eukprot:jgi/Botrbrau1/21937/Bobra.0249s0060.1
MAQQVLCEPLLSPGQTRSLGFRRHQSCRLADGSERSTQKATLIQRKLWAAIVIAVVFMIIEVVGGLLANSLAIMTDAAHLLSDVSGFAVAIFAAYTVTLKSSSSHTFGYHRVEVLGALASVLSTWLVTGILVYEAIARVINPVEVNGKLMFLLAAVGVLVNVLLFAILGGHGHSHAGHGHCHGAHSHSHSMGGHDHSQGGHNHSQGGHNHSHGHGHSHGSGGGSGGHAEGSEHAHAKGACCGGGHQHSEAAGPDEAAAPACADGEHDHHHHLDLEEGQPAASPVALHGSQLQTAGPGGRGDKQAANMNLRGAVIHVLGDLVQSIGVAIAGALIWWNQDDPRWYLADPICTFVFALLVLFTTWAIMIDISDILMERVPRMHNYSNIMDNLQQLEGVDSVHDLHVWGLKPGVALLAVHLELLDEADASDVLSRASAYCREAGIHHSTIQISVGQQCPCGPSSPLARTSSHDEQHVHL